jgi:hypothetical protein
MPLAGFEPTIPVLERAKTFHALDRAATVTGKIVYIEQAKCALIGVFRFRSALKYFRLTDVILDWVHPVFYEANAFSDIRLIQIPFYIGLLYILAVFLDLATLMRERKIMVRSNRAVVAATFRERGMDRDAL